MARSRRKTPIFGNTLAESDKGDKIKANRRLRREVRLALKNGEEEMPELRDVANIGWFAKDGKKYRDDLKPEEFRK